MKRGTPDHPKILDLAEPIQQYLKEEQGIDIPFELAQTIACGIAERLWHYTARYSPDGGIGKHSNSRIARAFGWMYDADWIIEKMTIIKFFDRSETCRIYVHDWHQHSDDAADKWLRDHGLCYANGCLPRRKDKDEKRSRGKVKTRSGLSRDKSSQPEPKPEPKPEPSSEPSSKPEPEPKPGLAGHGSGVFRNEISEEMLRDTSKLMAWLVAESLKPEPLIRDSEQNRLFVVAIAERALDVGKSNPCGLFYKLIRDEERDYAGKYENKANARLTEFRKQARGSPASSSSIPRPTLRGVT